MNNNSFISTIEAASHLGLSPRTLEKFRVTGNGPEFYKFGRRCLYSFDELDKWVESRKRKSTSDTGRVN